MAAGLNCEPAMISTYLRIDASSRVHGSTSRDMLDRLELRIKEAYPKAVVIERDVGEHPPSIVDCHWIDANTTAIENRTDNQHKTLRESDGLISELREADTLLIGLPIYNFNVPASFKAWIDQICRARETFKYSEGGPFGLLKGKRVIIIITSGGTALGSRQDFITLYLLHIFSFLGIDDVELVGADRMLSDTSARINEVEASIDKIDLFYPASEPSS